MDLGKLEPHPFADLFPRIAGEQFAQLVASIRKDGLIQPIIIFDGMILDGRNRYRACKEAGVELEFEFHVRTFHGSEQEALAYVAATNLTRRHLTSSQRAMVAATMATLRNGGSCDVGREGAVSTAAAAEALSVSPFLVKQARRVKRGGCAGHIVAMVEAGQITLSTAEAVAELSAKRQAKLKTPDAVKAAAERQREASGPLGGYSPRRVLETIIAASLEPFSRSSLDEFVGAATGETVGKLDQAIQRLGKLRDAIAEAHGDAEALA